MRDVVYTPKHVTFKSVIEQQDAMNLEKLFILRFTAIDLAVIVALLPIWYLIRFRWIKTVSEVNVRKVSFNFQ